MKQRIKILLAMAFSVVLMSLTPVSAAKKPYIKITTKTSVTLLTGKTEQIKAKTIGKKRKITYKSSKKSIATVNKKGQIKAKKYGTTTISLKAKGMKTKKVKVSVKKPITGLKLVSPSAIMFSASGKTYQIKTTITPSAKYIKTSKLTYSSSFPSVATVSSTGKITAKNSGYTRIKIATSKDAGKVYEKYMDVYVNIRATQIQASNLTLKSWESKSVNAKVLPNGASSQGLTYTSSDPDVAIVSADGVVTGIKAGTANIVISDSYSKLSKTVKVTVVSDGEYQWPNEVKYTAWDGKKTAIDIDPSLKAVQILFKSKNGTVYAYTVTDIKNKFTELVNLNVPFSYTKNGVTVSKTNASNKNLVTFKIDATGETYDVYVKDWLCRMEFQQNIGQDQVFFSVVK